MKEGRGPIRRHAEAAVTSFLRSSGETKSLVGLAVVEGYTSVAEFTQDRPLFGAAFGILSATTAYIAGKELQPGYEVALHENTPRQPKERSETVRDEYARLAPIREIFEKTPSLEEAQTEQDLEPQRTAVRKSLHDYLDAAKPHLNDVVRIKDGSVKGKEGISAIPFSETVGISWNFPTPSEYYLPASGEIVSIDPERQDTKGSLGFHKVPQDRFPEDRNFIGFDALREDDSATFHTVDEYLARQNQGMYNYSLGEMRLSNVIEHNLKPSAKDDTTVKTAKDEVSKEASVYRQAVADIEATSAQEVEAYLSDVVDVIENNYYGPATFPDSVHIPEAAGLFYLPHERKLVHAEFADWRKPTPVEETIRDATPQEVYRARFHAAHSLVRSVMSQRDRLLISLSPEEFERT